MATEVRQEEVKAASASIENLFRQLVNLQFELISIPFSFLPGESRKYATDTVRSAFKAVRVVVDDVSELIDSTLVRNLDRNDKSAK